MGVSNFHKITNLTKTKIFFKNLIFSIIICKFDFLKHTKMDKETATSKVLRLIKQGVTKKSIADQLSMSFFTLSRRLENNNWTKPELLMIELMRYE